MKCMTCGGSLPVNTDRCWKCGAVFNAAQPPFAQIPNNLVWAILATVFCCMPLGIPAIVYAARVDGKMASRDFFGARADSDNAKKWAIIAAIAGAVLGVLYLIALVAAGN